MSFRFALKGIKHLFRYEHNAWIQAVCALGVIALGIYLKISSTEWAIILLCIGLVFTAEIINTAIELLVDMVTPEYNETAGKIKDLAAGGVLICSIVALVVGVVVFLGRG